MSPTRSLQCLAAAALLAVGGHAALSTPPSQEVPPTQAERDFERLKSLAGDWRVEGQEPIPWSFRVTAAGHAVLETLFMGTDHEMISVYHMDGQGLALTHYCAIGNQPHMHRVPTDSRDELAFECIQVGNMQTPEDPHMHAGRITFVDADHIRCEWVQMRGEQEMGRHAFDLVRVK